MKSYLIFVFCLFGIVFNASADDEVAATINLQHQTPSNHNEYSQYVIASDVTAGRSVDSGRTNGDVIVKNGVEYEIEASGTVTLEDGFSVEKGATFAVYPSSF